MKSPVLMSIASGALAAIAAGLGKVALSSNSTAPKIISENCDWVLETYTGFGANHYHCDVVVPIIVRLLVFLLMMYLNALMLSLFLKALGMHGSLDVVVLNSSINFVLTGLIGQLVFGESVSRYWAVGITLIAIGIALITFAGQTRSAVIPEDDTERTD